MNCKQGDLAVVVACGDYPNAIGNIIRLGESISGRSLRTGERLPGWIIDGPAIGNRFEAIADRCVRPIRDQPGDDETLTWARKPKLVTA